MDTQKLLEALEIVKNDAKLEQEFRKEFYSDWKLIAASIRGDLLKPEAQKLLLKLAESKPHLILNSVSENTTKFYVLVEDSIEKVVAIIEAPYNEDCLPKVLQAIREDLSASNVTLYNSKNYEVNVLFAVEVEQDGEEPDTRNYTLYRTEKY